MLKSCDWKAKIGQKKSLQLNAYCAAISPEAHSATMKNVCTAQSIRDPNPQYVLQTCSQMARNEKNKLYGQACIGAAPKGIQSPMEVHTPLILSCMTKAIIA